MAFILKKTTYKNIEVVYNVDDTGRFWATAINSALSTRTHNTMEQTEKEIKKQIDDFLIFMPKTWEELAFAITSKLTWTSYEDCYLDTDVCKILVSNFLISNPTFNPTLK